MALRLWDFVKKDFMSSLGVKLTWPTAFVILVDVWLGEVVMVLLSECLVPVFSEVDLLKGVAFNLFHQAWMLHVVVDQDALFKKELFELDKHSSFFQTVRFLRFLLHLVEEGKLLFGYAKYYLICSSA